MWNLLFYSRVLEQRERKEEEEEGRAYGWTVMDIPGNMLDRYAW